MTAPIPVHLLTGFLGSGKTTLLRRLLADPALAGAAVLINEFGEIGLDHHLVERIDDTIVLLKSGCLCCTIRGELATAIRDLLSARERGLVPAFGRLVIESTGLADPFPILTTLRADPVLGRHVALASVIATVDAVNVSAQLAAHRETVLQIASADRIVLTKTDLVEAEAVRALSRRLGAINPGAPIVDVHGTNWSAADLVTAAQGWAKCEARARPIMTATGFDEPGKLQRHDGDIAAFAIMVGRPIDWTRFGLWLGMLLNRHGDRILRVKGILALAGEERPVAIHGVRHLVHPPTHMATWPTPERGSRIVFITDGISEEQVLASLAAFGFLDAAAGVLAPCGG